ncbi:MAG: RidA family protein [Deltaproteobacteria bacterium]|nr:RidA family protein [Deltaproteobacteria bacterium]
MAHRMLNPSELAAPKGSSHAVLSDAGGKVLAISGQFGWDSNGKMVGEDVGGQFKQALKNLASILRNAGGAPDSLLRLNIYITNRDEYLKAIESIGKEYKLFIGRHVPAMTLIVVKDLLEAGAKVCIEGLAVLPEKAGAVEFQRHGQGVAMPDAGLRGAGGGGGGRPPPGGIRR